MPNRGVGTLLSVSAFKFAVLVPVAINGIRSFKETSREFNSIFHRINKEAYPFDVGHSLLAWQHFYVTRQIFDEILQQCQEMMQ